MTEKNILIKDQEGNSLFPQTKASLVITSSGSNLGDIETVLEGKQDKLKFTLPLENGGVKTSTDNISYDNNGKAYLNDKAFWASIPELLPTVVGENRNENASFEDLMNTGDRAELRFRKLKGFNGVYPQLNLEGYNAIIRNFAVGDIVMADKIINTVQMCFGKLDNDSTFTPKLICRLQGSSSDYYKFAKMMFLYEPSYTILNTSSGPWDGNYYVEYGDSSSFKVISYKRQSDLGGIENFYGVKFIEKDNAYSLAWVSENGDVVELADSATFDELDFNCVIFNGYTFELPKADAGIYGFDPTKYFVANGTIDNVIVRMVNGTGSDGLSLKYNADDFKLNANGELSLSSVGGGLSYEDLNEEVEVNPTPLIQEWQAYQEQVNAIVEAYQQQVIALREELNQVKSVRYVVETYQNGTDWYVIYSDGWCEQGGIVTGSQVTVTFKKPFANTDYYMNWIFQDNTNTSNLNFRYQSVNSKTTTTAVICNSGGTSFTTMWEAKGYIL